MIIVSHKEMSQGYDTQIVHDYGVVYRKYAESDLIFIKGKDYISYDKETDKLTLSLYDLMDNLKYIYQDAYRQGREEAINQMMHP